MGCKERAKLINVKGSAKPKKLSLCVLPEYGNYRIPQPKGILDSERMKRSVGVGVKGVGLLQHLSHFAGGNLKRYEMFHGRSFT
jgi:hypothetical protein